MHVVKKLNVVVEENNKYFINIHVNALRVRFVCFSLCVLSVNGGEMDLSVMTAKSSWQSAGAAK